MNAKRNFFGPIALLWVCAALAGLSAVAPAVAGTTGTTYYTCTVNISTGTNTCTENVITATTTSGITRVLRADLGPDYQRLDVFADVCNPTGWWIHLADSPTNNGFGGDGATTQHDAEAHFIGTQLAVYDDDFGNLAAVEQGVIAASGCYRVQWSAMENTFLFDNDGNPADAPKVSIDSYEGFEMAPYFEADSEDPSGADASYWYIGINRTVYSASRSGTGVGKACFVLSATTAPAPATLSALCP